MTTSATSVIERLQGGALRDLAAVVVDYLLDRPVNSLLEPSWVAEQVVAALEGATSGDQTETWIRERVHEARDKVPEGTLGDRVPEEVVGPLRDVVSRAVVFDRQLVGTLLEHKAVESLLKHVLVGALHKFALRIKPPMPVTDIRGSAAGAASRLMGSRRIKELRALKEGMLGGLSGEIERQAEQKAREFVDGALQTVVASFGDHICDPEHAEVYGRYRAYLVDTLLRTDLQTIAHEVDKLDPDHLVATGTAVARALSRREGFASEVEAIVRAALDGTGGRSMRDFLQESGLEEGWREQVEDLVVARGNELIETPGFVDWLEKLLAE